jgi:hypothetical protein
MRCQFSSENDALMSEKRMLCDIYVRDMTIITSKYLFVEFIFL